MKFNLDEYVTIKDFNNMALQQRLDIVNKMLLRFDIAIINKHLGIDVTYLFWAFGFELSNGQFKDRNK